MKHYIVKVDDRFNPLRIYTIQLIPETEKERTTLKAADRYEGTDEDRQMVEDCIYQALPGVIILDSEQQGDYFTVKTQLEPRGIGGY